MPRNQTCISDFCTLWRSTKCTRHSSHGPERLRYGYITNTKIKLILIIDDTGPEVKEADLRSVHTTRSYRGQIAPHCMPQTFKTFHNAYIEHVLNPFYVPDEKIESKRFERRISAMIASVNKSPQ